MKNNERPYPTAYTLEEYKQWWPDFEDFTRFYFSPENRPAPFTRVYSWESGITHVYQVTGRWGMFVEHYRGGFGQLTVGEIVDEIFDNQLKGDTK